MWASAGRVLLGLWLVSETKERWALAWEWCGACGRVVGARWYSGGGRTVGHVVAEPEASGEYARRARGGRVMGRVVGREVSSDGRARGKLWAWRASGEPVASGWQASGRQGRRAGGWQASGEHAMGVSGGVSVGHMLVERWWSGGRVVGERWSSAGREVCDWRSSEWRVVCESGGRESSTIAGRGVGASGGQVYGRVVAEWLAWTAVLGFGW